MASVRGMTPEAILALIKRELANVKLSEGQIRDLIKTNADIVDSIVNLEDQIKAGSPDVDLDQLKLDLQQLRSDLQTQADALAAADTKLQENAQALIENQEEMALLSVLLSDEGYLNTEKIKPGTLLGEHLAARTVAALNIAAGAIVSEKIAADAITANHILAESITGDRLVARTVGADRLMADSITANEIAAGGVTAQEIAAGSISAEKISAEGISADNIKAGSISATRVELDGNDLQSQMNFILSGMDSRYTRLSSSFELLAKVLGYILDRPMYHIRYGEILIPDRAYEPFADWVNRSDKFYYATNEEQTHMELRVQKMPSGVGWYIRFPPEFEGVIQTYNGNTFVREVNVDGGRNFPMTISDMDFNRLVWFYQEKFYRPVKYQYQFNVGGQRIRNGNYMPFYNVEISRGASDQQRDQAVLSATASPPADTSTYGTGGTSQVLVTYSVTSGGLTDPAVYPFKRMQTIEVEANCERLLFSGRMRISQPKRENLYGFAFYHNSNYLGFLAEGGVGTLSGGSLVFSHEEVSYNFTFERKFAKGDTIRIAPIAFIVAIPPATEASCMEIDTQLIPQRL